jgi:hypothetical protein
MVIINTGRGPWRICVDPNCPAKAEAAAKKPAKGRGGAKRSATKPIVG